MKRVIVGVIALTLASPVFAQTPTANPDPATPAVTTPDSASPAAPAKGANSFTEAQARSRIEEKGFTQVTGLDKDSEGFWRGKAMKSGASHDVALDYQGNVFPH